MEDLIVHGRNSEMNNIAVLFFILFLALTGCGSEQNKSEADSVCQYRVDTKGKTEVCAADINYVSVNFKRMCDRRLIVFGYLAKYSDHFILFPDEFRERYGFVYSAIELKGSGLERIEDNFPPAGGLYVSLSGVLICRENEVDIKNIGFSEMRLERVWAHSPDGDKSSMMVIYDQND